MQKNLEVTPLFIDFSKALNSLHREKMEQIQLASGLLKKTVSAIMMLYRNIKAKVCSSDRNTNFSDIVAGVLQGNT